MSTSKGKNIIDNTKYYDRLIKGRCPECNKIFTELPDKIGLISCPDRKCGFSIDPNAYFEIVDEYSPSPEYKDEDIEDNLKKLNRI